MDIVGIVDPGMPTNKTSRQQEEGPFAETLLC